MITLGNKLSDSFFESVTFKLLARNNILHVRSFYSFLLANDGARLWIDGDLIIDAYEADVVLEFEYASIISVSSMNFSSSFQLLTITFFDGSYSHFDISISLFIEMFSSTYPRLFHFWKNQKLSFIEHHIFTWYSLISPLEIYERLELLLPTCDCFRHPLTCSYFFLLRLFLIVALIFFIGNVVGRSHRLSHRLGLSLPVGPILFPQVYNCFYHPWR